MVSLNGYYFVAEFMNSKEPKVCLILVNYNGTDHTLSCVASLDSINYQNYSIIIVDNGSVDDSVAVLQNSLSLTPCDDPANPVLAARSADQKISLIVSAENGGFGFGNNMGIEFGMQNGADYLLLLNNDTVVEEDFLDPLVSHLEANPDVGIVSGKVCFFDHRDLLWFFSGDYNPWTGKLRHLDFKGPANKIDPQEVVESTFIPGCMWLIPRRVIAEVGVLNEDYFMYVEDLEFCSRVRNAGYGLRSLASSCIYHKVGASTGGALSEFSMYWRTRNMNKYIRSHGSVLQKVTSFLSFNLHQFVKLLATRNIILAKSYFRGLLNR